MLRVNKMKRLQILTLRLGHILLSLKDKLFLFTNLILIILKQKEALIIISIEN